LPAKLCATSSASAYSDTAAMALVVIISWHKWQKSPASDKKSAQTLPSPASLLDVLRVRRLEKIFSAAQIATGCFPTSKNSPSGFPQQNQAFLLFRKDFYTWHPRC